MKGFAVLIVLLFSAFGVSDSYADNPALDGLIKTALENNPDIKAAVYERSAAEFKAGSAGSLPDPQFSVSAVNLPRTSLSLDETPMSGVVLGVSQMIPWPSKLSNKKGLANLQTDMKDVGITSNRNLVVRLVRHYYYEYSYWVGAEHILDSNITLLQAMGDVAETRYSNGIGSIQDVLRVRTATSRLDNKRIKMEQMQQSALLQLARLTDNTDLLNNPPESYLDNNIDTSLQADSIQNPQLQMAALQVSAADKKLSLAGAQYWPDLMVGFNYRIRKEVPMDPVQGEDFLSASIGFTLPLWFFSKQKNQTRAARQDLMASRERENSLSLQIDRMINDARNDLGAVRKQIARYENQIIPRADAAYQAAQVAYENGEVDFDGFLSTRKDLFEIEIERLELLKNFHQKKAELKEIIGESYGG